jgi:hypothetical protein
MLNDLEPDRVSAHHAIGEHFIIEGRGEPQERVVILQVGREGVQPLEKRLQILRGREGEVASQASEIESLRPELEDLVMISAVQMQELFRGTRSVVSGVLGLTMSETGHSPGIGGGRALDVVSGEEIAVNDEAELVGLKGACGFELQALGSE